MKDLHMFRYYSTISTSAGTLCRWLIGYPDNTGEGREWNSYESTKAIMMEYAGNILNIVDLPMYIWSNNSHGILSVVVSHHILPIVSMAGIHSIKATIENNALTVLHTLKGYTINRDRIESALNFLEVVSSSYWYAAHQRISKALE